jgi:hypothetical protein
MNTFGDVDPENVEIETCHVCTSWCPEKSRRMSTGRRRGDA